MRNKLKSIIETQMRRLKTYADDFSGKTRNGRPVFAISNFSSYEDELPSNVSDASIFSDVRHAVHVRVYPAIINTFMEMSSRVVGYMYSDKEQLIFLKVYLSTHFSNSKKKLIC